MTAGASGASCCYNSSEELSQLKDLDGEEIEALAPANDKENKDEDEVLNEMNQEMQIQPQQDQQVHPQLQNGVIIQARMVSIISQASICHHPVLCLSSPSWYLSLPGAGTIYIHQ